MGLEILKWKRRELLKAEASYDRSEDYGDYWKKYDPVNPYQVPVGSGLDGSLRVALEDRRAKARKVDYFVAKSHLDHDILPHGWGNGYAIVHRYHPFYGKNYDAISAEAPGGLTYCASGKDCRIEELPEEYRTDDYWVFGFDTCHWGDTLEKWPVEAVITAAQNLASDLASAVT